MFRLGLSIILTLLLTQSFAQNVLHSKVSISFSDEPVNQALIRLSDHSASQLAFNPDILPSKSITGTYENEALQDILDELLGKDYQYKIRGRYVIIQEAQLNKKKQVVQVTGKVTDQETGREIEDVSIYEVNRLTATLSSMDGSFDLTSKTYGNQATFVISKRNYEDTVITVDPSQKRFFNLSLKPSKKEQSGEFKEWLSDKVGMVKLFVNKKSKKHTQNVSLEESRLFQVSLVPGISTNGFISGQVKNNLSFNVVGGYVRGINGLELGGAFNMVREEVIGAQLAGAVNIVGDSLNGVQLSGAVNLNLKNTKGVQAAGAVNLSNEEMDGVQLSGAYNHALAMKGIQMAGAVNTSKTLNGLQLAGAINVSGSKGKGSQMAGAVNWGGDFTGLQVAGAANIANDMNGLQLSGVYNQAAGIVNGVQISGAINIATRLNGLQIGVINIAPEAQKGFMLGLINITKSGFLALEIDHNDVTDISTSFKSGPKHFYTILNSGITSDREMWSYGMGFGSQIELGDHFFTGLELTTHNLHHVDDLFENAVYNHRFNVSLGYKLSERIAIHGGPVLHFAHFDQSSDGASILFERVGTKPFSESAANQKWWIGYRVALRL